MTEIFVNYNEVKIGDKILVGKVAQEVTKINLWGKRTKESVHEVTFASGDIWCGWGEYKIKKVIDKINKMD